jgi:transposase
LDRGTFRLPEAVAGARHVEIDDATMEALLDGVDVEPRPPARSRAPRVH